MRLRGGSLNRLVNGLPTYLECSGYASARVHANSAGYCLSSPQASAQTTRRPDVDPVTGGNMPGIRYIGDNTYCFIGEALPDCSAHSVRSIRCFSHLNASLTASSRFRPCPHTSKSPCSKTHLISCRAAHRKERHEPNLHSVQRR